MLRKSELKGYNIPGVLDKVITKLFADDTTVYLFEGDNFADLQEILDKWCIASSAKFNVGKTEVIPIGSEEHRQAVIESRKLNEHDMVLPDNIHLAKDGEGVRILGAQVGNKVNISATWTPTIEKIDSALERWGRSHPTLEARRHITQITFGSMTQYRTQVNGMPKEVEKLLIKKQRDFIWAGKKSSPVQKEMLQAPIDEGGKNIFDLEARNQAIQLMKLKSYLELDPSKRATWAYLTDKRLARHDKGVSSVRPGVHVNMFMQKWAPNRRG
ncbi:hypothetical protein C8R43DRAFT_837046, partial [Mycena crocata]